MERERIMKKAIMLLGAAILAALMLAGCSTSSFEVVSSSSGATITAKNADTDSTGAWDITMNGNGKIVFDAAGLNKGKLQISLKDAQTGEEKGSASVSAKEKNEFSINAGEYNAEISVLELADGKASLSIEAN